MLTTADDETAAAILASVPCYPVPPSGRSPALDELRSAAVGYGVAIGRDGVLLIVRRPWLEMDLPITGPLNAYVPYGEAGPAHARLRCGLIPGELMSSILTHFRDALPNEAAAFILWNAVDKTFSVEFPQIEHATPTRLVYRPPTAAPPNHVICDVHSHGRAGAFFSETDDADDAHATKLSLVVGRLDDPNGPEIAKRLCAGGRFLPISRKLFTGASDGC